MTDDRGQMTAAFASWLRRAKEVGSQMTKGTQFESASFQPYALCSMLYAQNRNKE